MGVGRLDIPLDFGGIVFHLHDLGLVKDDLLGHLLKEGQELDERGLDALDFGLPFAHGGIDRVGLAAAAAGEKLLVALFVSKGWV